MLFNDFDFEYMFLKPLFERFFFDKKMILSDEERKIFVENESNKQKVYNKIKKKTKISSLYYKKRKIFFG